MNIRIKDARYAGTVYEDLPELPEFAFAGRSNVGKSSLINALLNRKALVRTSKQPGKTRNINFFHIDLIERPSIYMVDFPGYGYAKISQEMRNTWDKLAHKYFQNNNNLRLLMLLIDIRRDLREEEMMLLDLIKDTPTQPLIIATKIDKISKNDLKKRTSELSHQIGLRPVLSSATKRQGLDEIWDRIIKVDSD